MSLEKLMIVENILILSNFPYVFTIRVIFQTLTMKKKKKYLSIVKTIKSFYWSKVFQINFWSLAE